MRNLLCIPAFLSYYHAEVVNLIKQQFSAFTEMLSFTSSLFEYGELYPLLSTVKNILESLQSIELGNDLLPILFMTGKDSLIFY